MNKSLTLDFIKGKCADVGVTLLSDTYTKAKDNLKFKCACGNEFECSWDKFSNRNKTQCNECGIKLRSEKRKLRIEDIKQKCKKIGIDVLSSQYESMHKNLIFKCSCGETFERTWANVSKGQTKCLSCSNIKRWDIEKVKEKCNEIGVVLLSETYLNNEESMLFRCSCGKSFNRTWSQIVNNRQILCNKCSRKILSESQRNTIEYIKDRCAAFEIELLSKEYHNNVEKLSFKCKCGNIFNTSWIGVLSGKTCCNVCSKIQSKGEAIIEKYLKNNDCNYIAQYRISECKNLIPLPFDFAIFDKEGNLSLLVEFDGAQHFKPINFGGITDEEAYENFKRTKIHDEIKNKYCETNKLNLLRIPYWDKNNIEKILINILN